VPLSIKTITGSGFSGVKLIWTVDAQKARIFYENYYPCCDILLVQIIWGGVGGLFFIPSELQAKYFDNIGRESYIKLPKPGTNPRGVEISKEALSSLVSDVACKRIKINWQKTFIDYDPYKRWVDLWMED
jgi:hypothetical protein